MPKQPPKTRLVLSIAVWFDPQRGHEVTNRGRPIKSPLKWFKVPVHRGEALASMSRAYGEHVARMSIYVYDQLCHLIAPQPAERRGRLFDVRGAPIALPELARLLHMQPSSLQRVIDAMVEQGWLVWLAPNRRPSGAWTARQLCANGAPPAPDAPKVGAPDKASRQGKQKQASSKRCRQEDKASSGPPGAAGLPALSANGGEAVGLPLPASSRTPSDETAKGLLIVAGLDRAKAVKVAEQIGHDAELVQEALEAAMILHDYGELRGTATGYVLKYVTEGPYTLPGKLEQLRTRRVKR